MQLKATKQNKKAYSSNELKVFPVYQSKQIEISGKRYTLVGQKMYLNSPFYTFFDVFDGHRKRADQEISRQVNRVVAIHLIAASLYPVKESVEKQMEAKSTQTLDVPEELQMLFDNLEEIQVSLHSLLAYTEEMSNFEVLDNKQSEQLIQYWNSFSDHYQARWDQLIKILQQSGKGLENSLIGIIGKNGGTALYQEVATLSQISSSFVSLLGRFPTSMDELIEAHFELGFVQQQKTVALKGYDRFFYRLLTILLKGLSWLIIPLSVILFIAEGFDFSLLLFPAMIVVIYLPIYRQYEARLRLNLVNLLEKDSGKRIEPIEDVKLANKKEDEHSVNDQAFHAEAISINMGSGSFFIALMLAFMTFVLWWLNGWDSITKAFLYLTILSIVISCWLPYSKLIKRKVRVVENEINIGNRSIYPNELKEVVCIKEGLTFEFHIVYQKEAVKIRIEDEYQSKARDVLRSWCEKANIPFKEVGHKAIN